MGLVQLVQGDVLVVHGGEKKAYTLQENAPVFNKDTFVTGKRPGYICSIAIDTNCPGC